MVQDRFPFLESNITEIVMCLEEMGEIMVPKVCGIILEITYPVLKNATMYKVRPQFTTHRRWSGSDKDFLNSVPIFARTRLRGTR